MVMATMMAPAPLNVPPDDMQRILREACAQAYQGAALGVLESAYGGPNGVPADFRIKVSDAAESAAIRYCTRGSRAVYDAAHAGAGFAKGLADTRQRDDAAAARGYVADAVRFGGRKLVS